MDIAGGVDEELQNFIPNTCSNSPVPGFYCLFIELSLHSFTSKGHAFCDSHCKFVKSMGYPTELKPFLKSCGKSTSPVDPEQYTKDMMNNVNQVIKTISKNLHSINARTRSATDAQGKQAYHLCWHKC